MPQVTVTWTNTASATIDVADFEKRRYRGKMAEIFHQSLDVWWTDDDTATGDNLFDPDICPHVNCMIQARGQDCDWIAGIYGGPMLDAEYTQNLAMFSWETNQSGGKWRTRLFRKGQAADGDGQEDDLDFLVFFHAIGPADDGA